MKLKEIHWIEIRKLPLLGRLFHRDSRKHVTMVATGVGICLTGSFMATCGHSQVVLPHFIWDAISYSIHGVGLIPICHHAEYAWHIVFPEEQNNNNSNNHNTS